MAGGNDIGWRRIIRSIAILAAITARSLNVVHTIVGSVGIVYRVAIGKGVVNGAMHVHHQFGVRCYDGALLKIPHAVDGGHPVGIGIIELATIEKRVGVGLGVIGFYHAKTHIVEGHRLVRVVIQDDALVDRKLARAIVFLAATHIQFFNNDGVGRLHGGKRYRQCYRGIVCANGNVGH